MADQPPRRRVTAQISLGNQSTPGPSAPRARAKVDVGSIATPPSRPPLRNSPSASSLTKRAGQAHVRTPGASSTPMRAASPITPRSSYPPNQPESRVTPVIRARATPTAIGRSATTPSASTSSPAQSGTGKDYASPVPSRGISRPPSTVGLGVNVTDRRAKVKLPDSASSPRAPYRPPLSSPLMPQVAPTFVASPMSTLSELNHSQVDGPTLPTYTSGYDLEPTSSFHSLPDTPAIPSHLYHSPLNPQHPNASCPPSPPTGVGPSKRRGLPPHPALAPITTYNPPSSPQLHIIALPSETPRRNSVTSQSSDGPARDTFAAEGVGLLLPDARDFAGSADLQSENGSAPPGDDSFDTIGDDAEEAKINRKIADLEISNASLMAINKMLETTKAKQRTEILKLRRALRESRDGVALGLGMNRAFPSPLSATTPGVDELDDPLEGEEAFDEMEDPEMEERWEKIQDLVSSMQRRAQTAVERGLETGRVAAQRVLDWTEVEEPSPAGTPSSAGD